ncbi:hypothetical protein [Paludibaculum fermentans]|uniref:hypothetical protein n=1 Tax=Paludibaculum fermentans TaxID=1473598 RepID=UPI003EBE59DB
MPSVTLLRGAVAAGEGVVRLAPNFAENGERWIASISEPHLSCIAIGARRIPLRDAFEKLPDWYLGAHAPGWNVLARWSNDDLTLQPLDDVELGPCSDQWKLRPGESRHLQVNGPAALFCLRGRGLVSKVDIQAPHALHDGKLTPDELFITGERARRGLDILNTSADQPLELLRIFSGDPTA